MLSVCSILECVFGGVRFSVFGWVCVGLSVLSVFECLSVLSGCVECFVVFLSVF